MGIFTGGLFDLVENELGRGRERRGGREGRRGEREREKRGRETEKRRERDETGRERGETGREREKRRERGHVPYDSLAISQIAGALTHVLTLTTKTHN